MKTKSTSQLASRNSRVLMGRALYVAGLILAVALIGGAVAEENATAELSQSRPAQALGRWKVTGDLNVPRGGQTATLLQNGQVLVAGGDATGVGAELYDPVTDVWTATGNLITGRRESDTATLLPNGQVLVTGGISGTHQTDSAEQYDPTTGTWAATASLKAGRYGHTATLLFNGQVLVAGGASFRIGGLTRAQLYRSAP
jgi:N-acetylneuraminic acid mutarotase